MRKFLNTLQEYTNKGWVQILCGVLPISLIWTYLIILTHEVMDNIVLISVLIVFGILISLIVRVFSKLNSVYKKFEKLNEYLFIQSEISEHRGQRLYTIMCSGVEIKTLGMNEYAPIKLFDQNNQLFTTSFHNEMKQERLKITEELMRKYGDEKTTNEILGMVTKIYGDSGL